MLGTTDPRPTERQLLSTLTELLTERLPVDWKVDLEMEPSVPGRRVDGVLTITSPDGSLARLAVETRSSLYPRDAYSLSDQLGSIWPATPRPPGRIGALPDYDGVLVMTSFLTPRTQAMLKQVGFSYADATGNLRISTQRPGLFMEASGASENPWLETRTLRSLKGSGSARVVRALLDFKPPYTLRNLATRAGLALGTTSRVLTYLAEEALISRNERGSVDDVDISRLLKRWTEDYQVLVSNQAQVFLEPRGPLEVLSRLRDYTGSYAVTGSGAAIRRAQIATPALLEIYADRPNSMAQELQLRPTPGGGNVVLLNPVSGLAFERTWSEEGITYAALSQVAADLLTSPGRGPTEADALIEWLETSQDAWRQS